jgi:hypothetical protein
VPDGESLTTELQRLITWTSQTLDDTDMTPGTLPLHERLCLLQMCSIWLKEIANPKCDEKHLLTVSKMAVTLSEQTRQVRYFNFRFT